jgi:hypothetical protein
MFGSLTAKKSYGIQYIVHTNKCSYKRQEVVAHAWRYSRKCTVHSHLQYRQHSLFMNDVPECTRYNCALLGVPGIQVLL